MVTSVDARAKVWHQLKHAAPQGIEQVTIRSSPVLASATVDLNRLTVIAGTHGVGKSYLLRTLDAAIPWGYSYPTGPPFNRFDRLGETKGRVEGKYMISYHTKSGKRFKFLADFDRTEPLDARDLERLSEHEPWSVYIDPSAAFADYAMYFQEAANISAVGLGEPDTLRRAETDSLRRILGREYHRLTWRSMVLHDDEIAPHMEAAVEAGTVTNHTMSTSELWVHYCLWRLRLADSDATVFIDEPEAFLSPASHGAFLDEIARLTLAKGCQTIVATHSASMIARTPPEMLRCLIRTSTGTQVIQPTAVSQVMRVLGHTAPIAGVVVVEDEFARTVVTAVLSRLDPTVAHQIDLVCAGGVSGVLTVANALATSRRLRVCAVLDGDQHDRGLNTDDTPVAYLPGNTPEESVLAVVPGRFPAPGGSAGHQS